VLSILALLVLTTLFAFVFVNSKDYQLRLAVGAAGGAFDRAVTSLAADLRDSGIEVELVRVARSTENPELVNDPDSVINAAFIAMSVDGKEYPDVTSVGTVASLPLILLVSPEQATLITSVRDLKGKRIEVGVRGSMRERTATDLLQQYGITEENSTFLHASSLQSLDNVEGNRADAVIVLTDPFDPFTTTFAQETSLTVIPLPESEAISGMNGYSSPEVIYAGSFALEPLIPAKDIPTVSVPATMIVHADLSEGIVYEIARHLSHNYGRGTVTSLPGEFPNFSDRQFAPNPSAADFYDTGAKPWQYSAFPIAVADLLLPLILALSVFLFVASLYSVVFPDSLSLWTGILQPRRDERALSKLEVALAEDRELTVKQRRLLSRVLAEQDRERSQRQRAEAMRSQLDRPVTAEHED
jgi:TRAP-type uncharacterized transport system substrate-binding protein